MGPGASRQGGGGGQRCGQCDGEACGSSHSLQKTSAEGYEAQRAAEKGAAMKLESRKRVKVRGGGVSVEGQIFGGFV